MTKFWASIWKRSDNPRGDAKPIGELPEVDYDGAVHFPFPPGLDGAQMVLLFGLARKSVSNEGVCRAMSEMILFECPSCQHRLKAKSKLLGKTVKCPKCGQKVQVPGFLQDETASSALDGTFNPLPEPDLASNPDSTLTPCGEHYQRIQRVLAKSRDAKKMAVLRLGARRDPDGQWEWPEVIERVLPQLPDLCQPFWEQEFPRDGEYAGPPLLDSSIQVGEVPLDLQGAELTAGIFACHMYKGFPLNGANLQRAKLDKTVWVFVSIMGADLSAASLRGCYMAGVHGKGATFRDADLSGSFINFAGFPQDSPIDFTGANFSGATIRLFFGPFRLVMTDANLQGCKVIVGSLEGADNRSYNKAVLDGFLGCLTDRQRTEISVTMLEPKRQCFIATAACGSDQAEEVLRLRRFRDEVLRRTRWGQVVIGAYECLSPPLARMVTHSTLARRIVRRLIIRPASRLVRNWYPPQARKQSPPS